MEGLTPVENMRETSKSLQNLAKNLPLVPKIKTLAKTSPKTVSFFGQLLVLQQHNPQAVTLTVAR